MIKRLGLLVLAMILATPALAQNSVYMEQVGDGAVVGILQQGSTNVIGTVSSKAIFSGGNLTVDIQQIGAVNTGVFDIQTNGNPTSVTSVADGNLNDVAVRCGAGGIGGCGDATIRANATGDMNSLTIDTTGKSISTIDVTGTSNTVVLNNTTTSLNGAKAVIIVSGDSNDIGLGQSGAAGALGHNGKIEVIGDSNIVGVTQGGTIDTKVNLKSTGNLNNITINTHN
jgi:hypothetical protein